jgi:acetyl-CoA synthase
MVAFAVVQGAYNIVSKAEGKYQEALKKYGGAQKLEFPNTAYFLPVIYSLTGIKVTDLDSAKQVMDFSRALLPPYIKNDCNLPYLGPILDAGMGAIFAEEIVEAIRYVDDPDFYQPEVEDPDVENGKIWLGAADDAIMKSGVWSLWMARPRDSQPLLELPRIRLRPERSPRSTS